ncbi:MAG: hypothetical protein ACFFCS_15585 [Candidatus Hodarchaeota archaeon]
MSLKKRILPLLFIPLLFSCFMPALVKGQSDITGFSILFVDDPYDTDDFTAYYTSIFDSLGLDYTTNTTEANSSILSQYPLVVWTTGESESYAGTAYKEGNLTTYLQGGGRLFLSSQDWIYAMGSVITPFMQNYMGVGDVDEDVFGSPENITDTLVGRDGDPIGDGISSFNVTYPVNYGQYGDYLTAASGSHSILYNTSLSGNNSIAVRTENNTYDFRTVYFGVPFEALNLDRTLLMSKCLLWLVEDLITGNDNVPGYDIMFLGVGIVLAVGYLYYQKRRFKK